MLNGRGEMEIKLSVERKGKGKEEIKYLKKILSVEERRGGRV